MALAYRAYFALIARPLINSKGENTSAVYGFVTALMKILTEERPEFVAVVFDARGPTFRHKRYPEYKATRQKMPEDMAGQMEKLKETVSAFKAPLLEIPGFEADDVIGTIARRAEREGVHTYMVTGDKDFMQLISPLISIYKPGKGGSDAEVIDRSAVEAKFGVPPERVVDVLGLMGDSSDNVPGVAGIGPKTAIPLIQKYGSIPELYERLEDVPQKGVREKLRASKDLAFLSRELVTIQTNVPVKIDFHSLRAENPDKEKLSRLFQELEFKTLINRIPVSGGKTHAPEGEASPLQPPVGESDIRSDKHVYSCVRSRQDLIEMLGKLEKAHRIALDTETTSEFPMTADIVGLAFSTEPGTGFFVPVPDPSLTEAAGHGWHDVEITRKEVLDAVQPILENPFIEKTGQNGKFDLLVLMNAGINVQGFSYDTMVASYVIRSDGRHSLDSLAMEHLRYRMIAYEDIAGSGKEKKPLREVDLSALAEYSAQDADITLRVSDKQRAVLEREGLRKLCEQIEFPLVPVLARMEYAGIHLDTDHLSGLSGRMEGEIAALVDDIHELAGERFNINSTQQLAEVLFQRLKLRTVRKTKTGYSTDAGVLEALRNEHPIVAKLLDYRMLTKLKSTYIDALPQLVNPKTGRLHTSFNQTVAATGRLASNDPNLQNIPIRTEEGRQIRKAFVPGRPNNVLMSADYSQIELRVMAHICGDEGLTEAFRNGEDIHTTTASRVFGVSSAGVRPDMRRKAKEVNFGIMYGLSPFGLANRLEIGQPEAREIIQNYFLRFPKVKQYIHDTIASARQSGYVSTLTGRRRYLPDINSRNSNIRSNAERQAINMPIQGTAADMIKRAMIGIDGEIRQRNLDSRMLLQVHDELLFEVPDGEIETAKGIAVRHMRDALPLSVPIEVEVGTGQNWLDAH
jgi:DNA polymerase-1